MTPALTLYYVLRGLALCVAIPIGFYICSAVVWVPFYAGEDYTLRFQDRILGLIGYCLFFVAIIVPYRWTIATPYYQIRMGLIIIAAAWVLWVDTRAYAAGLTRERFPPSSWLAVTVAVLLCITLYMRRARKDFARDSTAVPNNSLDASGITQSHADNLCVIWLTAAASTPPFDGSNTLSRKRRSTHLIKGGIK